jgi:hypothetical protein
MLFGLRLVDVAAWVCPIAVFSLVTTWEVNMTAHVTFEGVGLQAAAWDRDGYANPGK